MTKKAPYSLLFVMMAGDPRRGSYARVEAAEDPIRRRFGYTNAASPRYACGFMTLAVRVDQLCERTGVR
jgi:hypothetical protein